jgi:hypothetical protein
MKQGLLFFFLFSTVMLFGQSENVDSQKAKEEINLSESSNYIDPPQDSALIGKWRIQKVMLQEQHFYDLTDRSEILHKFLIEALLDSDDFLTHEDSVAAVGPVDTLLNSIHSNFLEFKSNGELESGIDWIEADSIIA